MSATIPSAPSERLHFPGLLPSAFEHPLDRSALEVLRRTPGIDVLFRKLASLHFERLVRIHFTADSLRLSPRQCPRIYEMLTEGAAILDVPPPELYLLQKPVANAFAMGMDRHTMVITSALVDLMDDDELRCVIGHELGHIKSGHMLYRTVALFLGIVSIVAGRNLPFINLLTQALIYAFYDWSRKSELTADRAGLLVAQDPDVVVRTLLKLAGGAQAMRDTISVEEFLKQADDYEDLDSNLLDVFYKLDLTLEQTHPFPALRAREITRWASGEEYRRILSGDYARDESRATERRCTRCAAPLTNPLFRFCPECGAPLDP